jgi:cell division protein FtsW
VILIICFILLIAVLIPGIGVVRGGARSWLGIGSLGIQPSEFMKLGMVIFLAKMLSENQHKITNFIHGLMPPLLVVGAAFGLIMLQPDLGTGAVLVGASLLVIYAAGARMMHLFALGMAGFAGLAGLILAAPYRLKRITAFLDPWQDPLGAGYQAIQSLYAIGPGGLVGLGLGMSRQKYSYLPEPQTDFIFSIIAEELGFIGGSTVLALFMVLLWRGMRTAIAAPDTFGSLLAVGIVGMIAVQVIINIGVVIGMLPVTGITLPLISAGGSSLTLILTSIGLLLNISRYSR